MAGGSSNNSLFGISEARDILAAAYMESKRYSAARAQIGRILELGGDTVSRDEVARHHANIALSFMYEKAFDKAIVESKTSINTAPNASPIPYDNLARIYALTDKIPLAIEVLKRAVERFPSSRETRLILSVLYASEEKYLEAILLVEELRKFGSLSDDNYASLGSYYGEAGFPEKAIDVLMEGYASLPKSMAIINNLAYFLLIGDQTARAKEILNSRPRSMPDHVEMIATLGLLHLKEGDYEGARRLYKRAENMAAKSSRKELARRVRQKMHLELARYHVEQGQFSTARREVSAGLQEKNGNPSYIKELKELEQT